MVKEFKREMNRAIRRKLTEAERPPKSTEQWYKCITNLDRHWRENREEERLRDRKESRNQEKRQEALENNQGGVRP